MVSPVLHHLRASFITLYKMKRSIRSYVRFEVLAAVKMMMFFLVVTVCRLVDIYQHLREKFCLVFSPEDGDGMLVVLTTSIG